MLLDGAERALIDAGIGDAGISMRLGLAALAQGLTTAEDITRAICGALPDGIRRAAILTIEAHLEKLREDGRA